MNKINLWNDMKKQLDFFINKFKEIEWKQEDTYYIFKKVNFLVNPEARNNDYKYGFGIVFYSDLLSYTENNKYILTPWVCGKISIENNPNIKYPVDCPRLDKVANFIKEELKKINWKPFYDEDSFKGIFSKPELRKNTENIEIKFYLNKEYPKGYWQNHTL